MSRSPDVANQLCRTGISPNWLRRNASSQISAQRARKAVGAEVSDLLIPHANPFAVAMVPLCAEGGQHG